MRLLLDTHLFVWSAVRPSRLPAMVLEAVHTADAVFISAVAAYEIEYKRRRDPELSQLPANILEAATAQGFEWLPIRPDHAIQAAGLPDHHRDPWDRLHVAQALVEELLLVTGDSQIHRYVVPTLW